MRTNGPAPSSPSLSGSGNRTRKRPRENEARTGAAKASRQSPRYAATPASTIASAVATALAASWSASAFWRVEMGTVSPMYTSEAGITAAKSPPAKALATTRTARFGARAESRPGTSAATSASRITRTRPSLSESIPQTGCISP